MENGKPGVYNIALGKKINLLELADTIMEIAGITVPVTFAPPAAGDIKDSLADISRAREMGYEPHYTVKSGLEETVGWYRQQDICR
jgi:dTDP-D-glucose 4,6-dehydratase